MFGDGPGGGPDGPGGPGGFGGPRMGMGGPPPGEFGPRFGGGRMGRDACCLGEACCAAESLSCLSPWLLAGTLWTALLHPHRHRGPDPDMPRGFGARLLYRPIRFYRTAVSPRRRPVCPYTPSCSTYAVQALRRHGALRGGWLTLRRLVRCRPGTRGGIDPVPVNR